MLDPLADGAAATISVSQLEGAMPTWSEARYTLSSDDPSSRRYSFDVPLPARVLDAKVEVAQRVSPEGAAVVMATAVPMIAGQALVLSWYGAMAASLSAGDDARTFKLFEAALSVPIRLRLAADTDA